jgi:hypothetical protein
MRRLLQVLQQSTRRGHDNVGCGNVLLLHKKVSFSSNQESDGKDVMSTHCLNDVEYLHGQFSRGAQYNGAGTILRGCELPSKERFHDGNDKGERLATARPRRTENVSSGQGVRDTGGLNGRHGRKGRFQ